MPDHQKRLSMSAFTVLSDNVRAVSIGNAKGNSRQISHITSYFVRYYCSSDCTVARNQRLFAWLAAHVTATKSRGISGAI
jgi:hypothetical protein